MSIVNWGKLEITLPANAQLEQDQLMAILQSGKTTKWEGTVKFDKTDNKCVVQLRKLVSTRESSANVLISVGSISSPSPNPRYNLEYDPEIVQIGANARVNYTLAEFNTMQLAIHEARAVLAIKNKELADKDA